MTPRSSLAHLAQYGTPPDRQTAQAITVGLEKTLERIAAEVFPYLATGGSELQFVFGANGRGKTHYLLSLEERAQAAGFATARIDCSAVGSPFAHLRTTYEIVAAALSPPSPTDDDSVTGLPALIQAALSNEHGSTPKQVLQSIRYSRQLAPDIRNLIYGYASGFHSERLTEKLTDDLEALLLGSRTRAVTFSSLYKADPSLPRPLGRLNERTAPSWLRSLFSLPSVLGFRGLVVLFDETERAMHKLKARERQAQLANLRNLVDYCALNAFSGCMILYAAAEDFVDVARQDLEALAQRIEPPSLLTGHVPSSIRSVWTDLEDLTFPRTEEAAFFERLGLKLLEIGTQAGLSPQRKEVIRAQLADNARRYARSPTSSVVREFVRLAASTVLQEVKTSGRR